MYSAKRVYKVGSPLREMATCFGSCASAHLAEVDLVVATVAGEQAALRAHGFVEQVGGSWSRGQFERVHVGLPASGRCRQELH